MSAPERRALPRAYWIVYAFAIAALFLGTVQFEAVWPRVLPATAPFATAAASPSAGSFASPGVYSTTNSQHLPARLELRGSWLESDAFQGEAVSAWHTARTRFTVLIAGYPALAPNRLELEVRHHDGTLAALRYDGANPGEHWRPWEITLPATAAAVRLRATDASSAPYGWLAFSAPFVDHAFAARQLWPLLQLGATTCLALTLLHGPGLLWLRRRERPPSALAFAIVAGPLLLAGLGLTCWLLGGVVAPAKLARIGIGGLLAGMGVFMFRTRAAAPLPAGAGAVLAAGTLLAAFAVAKANLSLGPAGELFGGTVSRTLAVGGHSDSRTSYHIVQLVASHAGPFSAQAESHYSPWSFANRGPLGGLIAAPVVLALGADPRIDAVNHPWAPFDRQGFATYRITQIVLAALAAWAVFGAAAAVLPAAGALFTASVVLLAPFYVHELYFTWPKLATAAFVLLGFVLAVARRPLAAGGALGLAYLFHPLALFSLPFLGLWILVRAWRDGAGARRLAAPALFTAGVLPLVIPWVLLGRLAPLRTGSQTVFLDYFRLSNGKLESAASAWWLSRWENFGNTFVPFHLFTVDRAHESINSVYAPSDPWVQAAFLYWNTLPFAVGLPAFVLLLAAVAAVARRAPAVVAVAFAGPALFLVAYWGAASSGLMRHCGHVLFVSFIVLGAWSLHTHAGAWRDRALAAFLHPACFTWRGLDVALMAFGTTLLHARPDWRGPLGWNDGVSLALAAACLAGAVILLAKASAALKHPPSVAPAAPVSST